MITITDFMRVYVTTTAHGEKRCYVANTSLECNEIALEILRENIDDYRYAIEDYSLEMSVGDRMVVQSAMNLVHMNPQQAIAEKVYDLHPAAHWQLERLMVAMKENPEFFNGREEPLYSFI